jgi:hypothetical protein
MSSTSVISRSSVKFQIATRATFLCSQERAPFVRACFRSLRRIHVGERTGIDFEWQAKRRIRNCELANIVLLLLDTELRPVRDVTGLVPRDTKTPLLHSFQKRVQS